MEFERFEQAIPDCVPRFWRSAATRSLLNLLKFLADESKRPAELHAALGISSANFFTSRYLTPLADAGYISVVGGESLHSPQLKYRLSVKGKRVVS